MSERVLVVGGGFAGVAFAHRLARHAPGAFEVTLIDQNNYSTFTPMLPEVVGASVLPGQVLAPLRLRLRNRARFVMGYACRLDADAKRLFFRVEGEERSLDYDHLVLASGGRARLEMIPGMAEHGIPLKLIGDALRIRNQVIARLEQADIETDAAHQRRLCHFVVVGGGFSGVEVAGEIYDFVRDAARLYPNVPKDAFKVTIVQDMDRLLPELPPRLAERALRSLRGRGLDVHLKAIAKAADAEGLEVERDGDAMRLETATVVCTIGTGPNPLIGESGLPQDKGRLRVRPDLSVEGSDDVWAVGDCALIPNAASDGPAPPTAQFAVREANHLAANLARRARGRPTRPFAYGGMGTIATIGSKRGIADVMGVPVTGLPAWLLWRAFYLFQMPTFSRKLRIYVAWTWDMLFSSDTADLRFTSSREADRTHRQETREG
jgi:NADH dehydrogenase